MSRSTTRCRVRCEAGNADQVEPRLSDVVPGRQRARRDRSARIGWSRDSRQPYGSCGSIAVAVVLSDFDIGPPALQHPDAGELAHRRCAAAGERRRQAAFGAVEIARLRLRDAIGDQLRTRSRRLARCHGR